MLVIPGVVVVDWRALALAAEAHASVPLFEFQPMSWNLSGAKAAASSAFGALSTFEGT